MTYTTEIKIWSRTGHTPITHRTGAYCDLLVDVKVECTDPDHALQVTKELKDKTQHAFACHFNMHGYPNQNTRSQFCHYG